MGYLVTSIWRGSLHIFAMRVFPTEDKAWEYASTLTEGQPKVYYVTSEAPPKLLKRKL